jgi:hypothetical protein
MGCNPTLFPSAFTALRRNQREKKIVCRPLENPRAGIGRQGKQMEALHLVKSKDQSYKFGSEKQKLCAKNYPRIPLEDFFNFLAAAFPFVPARESAFPGAESAHEKEDQADQQQQAKPAAADDGPTKVKPAATEQEKQNHHE